MPTILIVDDDPQIRTWLCSILEASGHRVDQAGDGYAALAYLKRAQPALVVVDLFMPKVDGLEVILHVRSQAGRLRVLAISGNPVPGYNACVAAKAFGAQDALAKPFSAETFLKHVETLLPKP